MKEDLTSANKMYNSFIASLKWTIPLLVVIVFLVILLIAE
jgi:hypothetical protein